MSKGGKVVRAEWIGQGKAMVVAEGEGRRTEVVVTVREAQEHLDRLRDDGWQ